MMSRIRTVALFVVAFSSLTLIAAQAQVVHPPEQFVPPSTPFAILDDVPDSTGPFVAVIGPVRSPTTGPVGLSCLRGAYQAYVEHHDLWKQLGIELVFLDDRSSSEKARNFALKLTQNPNCLAIVGSSDSGSTEAIDTVISNAAHPLPLISPVSSATIIGKNNQWVFRVNLTDHQMVDSVLRYLLSSRFRNRAPMRVASVYADSYYGQHVNADLKEICESYSAGTCQFLAGIPFPNQVTFDKDKIAESVAEIKPDVIGLFGQTLQCGPLAKAIRSRYEGGMLFATTANATPQFVQYAGQAAEGVLIVTSYSSAGSSTLNSLGWKDRFRSLYSTDPDNFGAQGFDALQVLMQAIFSTNIKPFGYKHEFDKEADERRDKIREQLVHTYLQGVLGPITFGPDRVVQIEPGLAIWNNSSLVPPALYVPPSKETWWRSRNAQTLMLFVGLVIVFLLLTKASRAVAGRWLPPIVASICAAGFQIDKVQNLFGLTLNGPLLLLLVSIAFAVGSLTLIVSPTWFRALIIAEPFSLIGLLLMRNARFRRHYFDRYIALSMRELAEDAKSANDETYVPIPTNLSTSKGRETELPFASSNWSPSQSVRGLLSDGVTTVCSTPVDIIVDSCVNESVAKRCHVCIEAPGGQGKSALLRAIVSEMYQRYRGNPRVPLPITLRGSAKTFPELISRSLGSETLPNLFLETLLESGSFALVFDGLSETDIDPAVLRDFLKTPAGEVTATIVSFRPDDKLRSASCSVDRWLHCEPLRLDESIIRTFINAYLSSADGKQGSKAPEDLMETIRNACRAEDGTFLPILVRLALLVNRTDISGVADLYRETVRLLLNRPDIKGDTNNLTKSAASLCMDTYWKHGRRLMAYADCDTDTKIVMKQLLSASLLVPVDSASVRISGAEPRAVKFFHDSVQSYLTARALGNQDSLDYLRRAAGDKLFLEARDGEKNTWRSELFEMCTEITVDKRTLFNFLAADLKCWAQTYDGELVKNRIVEVLPDEFLTAVQESATGGIGAGEWLIKAVNICKQQLQSSQEGEALRTLIRLYETVVPALWSKLKDTQSQL